MVWALIGLVALGAAVVFILVQLGISTAIVRADEVHMVTTPDLWRIRLCRYKAKGGRGEPVFFCHGFMSNQFNFALPPGASMAETLAAQGYDCWLIDLRGARSSIPPFGHTRTEPNMDDYVYRDIPAALEFIRKQTGFAKVHWVGHSMGGMLLYCYDADFAPGALASATAIGSPTGFDGFRLKRPSGVIFLRQSSEKLFRGFARIFMTVIRKFNIKAQMTPVNYANLHPKLKVADLFGAFEAPALPLAEEMFRIATTRKWKIDSGKVDVLAHLKKIHVPLFAIFGAQDAFIPAYAAEDFFKKVDNPDKKFLLLSKANGHCADYNHVDLVMGRESVKEVFMPVVDWLKAHPIAEHVQPAEKKEQKTTPDAEVIKPVAVETAQTVAAADGRKRKAAPPTRKPAAKKKAAAKKAPVVKTPAAKKPAAAKTPAKKATAAKTPAKPKAAAPKKTTAKKAAAPSETPPAESELVRAAASRAGELRAALEDIE